MWHSGSAAMAALLALALVGLFLGGLARRRQRRLADDPAHEAALNQRAIEWLRSHDDFDRVKLDGEVPRESVLLPGARARWLLVTNRRILLFTAAASGRRLVSEWPRRSIVFAGSPRQLPRHRSRWAEWLQPANLVLTFTTGTTLLLRCASAVTARRVAQLLMSSPALPDVFAETVEVPLPLPPRRRWPWSFSATR